ncbi:hypothetical protein AAMO2058_000928700 [Amorphochlora amoebiformis]
MGAPRRALASLDTNRASSSLRQKEKLEAWKAKKSRVGPNSQGRPRKAAQKRKTTGCQQANLVKKTKKVVKPDPCRLVRQVGYLQRVREANQNAIEGLAAKVQKLEKEKVAKDVYHSNEKERSLLRNITELEKLESELAEKNGYDYEAKKSACLASLSEIENIAPCATPLGLSFDRVESKSVSVLYPSKKDYRPLEQAKEHAQKLLKSARELLNKGEISAFVDKASDAIQVMLPHRN